MSDQACNAMVDTQRKVRARIRSADVFANEDARTFLEELGICDLHSAFRLGTPVTAERHTYKEVAALRNPAGDVIYVKRQWCGARRFARCRQLLRGGWPRSDAEREWHGLHALRNAGFDTAEPLALFRRRFSYQGAVVVRRVPAATSLQEILATRRIAAMTEIKRRLLLTAVQRLRTNLRDATISWRGFHAKHLYPEFLEKRVRLWLIDCERAEILNQVSQIDRNDARFLASVAAHDRRFYSELKTLD